MHKRTHMYAMGGNPNPVEDMKKKIIRAMEGGASDKEIMMMIQESPLSKKYEFNWDNVQMQVEVHPLKENPFGPKDKGGQRGDMFEMGGNAKPSKLNKLMEVARGSVSPEEGRRIEQNDFFNIRTDGEGITYYIGDDGDDAYIKTPDGEYMRVQREELIEAMGDQSDMMSRRQEGQRQDGVPMGGPFAGPYGGQGASKTEDLLERLSDVGRGRKAYKGRTYAY